MAPSIPTLLAKVAREQAVQYRFMTTKSGGHDLEPSLMIDRNILISTSHLQAKGTLWDILTLIGDIESLILDILELPSSPVIFH